MFEAQHILGCVERQVSLVVSRVLPEADRPTYADLHDENEHDENETVMGAI
jgi:hypothetical protein